MVTCPACSHADNPDGSRFCGMCGGALGELDQAVRSAVGDVLRKANKDNAALLWRKLYRAHQGQAVDAIIDVLADSATANNVVPAALAMAKLAVATGEGRARVGAFLDAAADRLPNPSTTISVPAFELICQAPAPPQQKWQALMEMLPALPSSQASIVIQRLPDFTPADGRKATGATIVQSMASAPDRLSGSAKQSLKALDCRECQPALREMLKTANATGAFHLSDLLAGWQDREAIPAIRQAVENLRYGASVNVCGVLRALYTLEGEACIPYLAEVLVSAVPQVQASLIRNNLKPVRHTAIADAVRQVARDTADPKVRAEAQAYLQGLGKTA